MEILRAEGLTKEYRMGRDYVVRALNGVDVTFGAGEMTAVMGPSGSGKSTLLHLLGCLDEPTSGRVFIEGLDLHDAPRTLLPQIRNQKIGFIFQQNHLIPTLTALENVMLPLRYSRLPRDQAKERATELLREVGLGNRMRHRPTELSGGQQQRVAIARALACRPAVLLADEPTGELDSVTSGQIVEMLLELNRVAGLPGTRGQRPRRLAVRHGRAEPRRALGRKQGTPAKPD